MSDFKFSSANIPYKELAGFGLSQEMIDDLPECIMNKFLSGQRTPLLPIEKADSDGVIHKDFARIRLVETGGEVHPLFLPKMQKNDLDDFGEEQKEALREGGVLKVVLPSNNSLNYVQLDGATNATLSVKADIIDQNLHTFAAQMGLSNEDRQRMSDGEVITKGEGDNILSSGIDLNEETGIRNVKGDCQKWKEEKDGSLSLDKYNFGIYGCWTKDDKGMLSYVPEDSYTEEMTKEQDAIFEKARQGRGFHL